MMIRQTLLAVALAAIGAAALVAQEDGGAAPRRGGFSSMLNTDLLLDNYVRLVGRKYDLTEEQETYTRELVHERADAFLEGHKAEVFDLVDRMFAVRSGAEMDADELVAWGERVRPIYDEAKQIIIAANDDWREILTEEQQAIHDQDLQLMYDNFTTTEAHLARVVSGEMTLEEFRNPPRMNVARAEKPRPVNRPRVEPRTTALANPPRPEPRSQRPDLEQPKPQPRTQTPQPEPSARPERHGAHERPEREQPSQREARRARGAEQKPDTYETQWDKYVDDFIKKYDLSDEQVQQAQAVLKSSKERAEQVMRRYKTKIERLDAEIEKLKSAKEKQEQDQRTRLSAQRSKLLQPLSDIFEKRLKPRLERIPTRAQREAAEKPRKPAERNPSGRAGSNEGP